VIRQVAMLTLRPGAAPDAVAAFERAMADAPRLLPAVRRSHLGRHLAGSVNGGDYAWDALLAEPLPPGDALALATSADALRPYFDTHRDRCVVATIDAVRFRPQYVAIPEPDITNCVKRTAFFRVEPSAATEAVAAFERQLMQMPQYIRTIRNWACSRPDPALQPTEWTHIWEQEYRDLAGLQVDYMVSPFHWGVVDRWFDAENPQRIVAPRLVHVFCLAASTILGWTA